MKYKLLLLLSISLSVMSADRYKLSPKEFLSKVDSNKITFKTMDTLNLMAKATLVNIFKFKSHKQVPVRMMVQYENIYRKNYQRQFTNYKDDYMHLRYIDSTGYRYSIAYDFATSKKCTLRISKIDSNCGNIICNPSVENAKDHPNVDYKGTSIDMKYCKKLYDMRD